MASERFESGILVVFMKSSKLGRLFRERSGERRHRAMISVRGHGITYCSRLTAGRRYDPSRIGVCEPYSRMVRLKLPLGAGSQFDVSFGRSFWIRMVIEPSGSVFSPSVVLPMLYRLKSFSMKNSFSSYMLMCQKTETGGVLPFSKRRTYLFVPESGSPLSSTRVFG